jgi:hypothetical protein
MVETYRKDIFLDIIETDATGNALQENKTSTLNKR